MICHSNVCVYLFLVVSIGSFPPGICIARTTSTTTNPIAASTETNSNLTSNLTENSTDNVKSNSISNSTDNLSNNSTENSISNSTENSISNSTENSISNSTENSISNSTENLTDNSTENSATNLTPNSSENSTSNSTENLTESSTENLTESSTENSATNLTSNTSENLASNSTQNLATFAAGCFWGVEHKFRQKFGKGLISIQVGYTGGNQTNPNYKEVCSGRTGHAEAIQLQYDLNEISYEELCLFFWRIHDSTTLNQQGNDHGTWYRSAVFYHSNDQKEIAERVVELIKPKFKDPIVTEIVEATTYYPAEEVHQKYLEKNPNGYCNHRMYW